MDKRITLLDLRGPLFYGQRLNDLPFSKAIQLMDEAINILCQSYNHHDPKLKTESLEQLMKTYMNFKKSIRLIT